jgi:hypothetical protein
MAGASATVKKRKAESSRFFVAGFFEFLGLERLDFPDGPDCFDVVRAMTYLTDMYHYERELI